MSGRSLLDGICRAIVGHPFIVLLGLGLVTLLAILQIVDVGNRRLRLQLDSSLNRLMPDDDDDRRFYEKIRQRFGSDDTLIVAFAADPLFTYENMRRVVRITDRIEALDGISRVVSLATALNIRGKDGDLRIEPFLAELSDDPVTLDAIRAEALENPVYQGNLVSRDGRATAIVIHVGNMTERQFQASGLEEAIVGITEEERGDAEVWITGTPAIKSATARTLLMDLAKVIPTAFCLTLVVAYLSFRSLRGVVIPMLSITMGILWTLAIMVLVDRPLNLVTTIIPALLLTIGFAESMHVVAHYHDHLREDARQGGPRPDVVYRTLRHVFIPVVVCGVTTVIGFASLTISPLSAIQEFGWFSVLGTTFIVLSSLLVGPALLELLGPPTRVREEREGTPLDRFSERVARFSVAHRRWMYLLFGAATVLAVAGMFQIRVSTDLITNFGPETPVRQAFEAVNDRLDGANSLFIVLESEQTDAFKEPENLRQVERLQAWLEQQEGVGSTTSVADYLKLVNRGFNDNDPAFLAIPQSKRMVSQLLTFAANDEIESLVDPSFKSTTILVRANVFDTGSVSQLVRTIEEHLTTLPESIRPTVTGNSVLISRTVDDLARGQAESLATGFLLIYGTLSLMFMSFRVGLLALVPNVFPVAAYFGLMGISGTTLNATTGLVACIVLGIAVDDTTHFMHRFNLEAKRLRSESAGAIETLRVLGRPVTLTTVALCLGFLVLAISNLRNQVQFGVLASATLAIGWFCEMLLTPAICSSTRVVTLWDVLALDLGEEPQKQVPLFRGLRGGQARVAALMMSLVSFPKGKRVLSEGEPGDDMYVVLDGELAASVETDEGRKRLTVMRRGDSVGEVALFHGVRTADVDAITDVRAVRLSRQDLARLRRRYPRISARVFWNLSQILASRVANTIERMR